VFENRVLKRIFGPKKEEIRGEWKRPHNEELYNLYSLPNIIRVIKSRRMRWTEILALKEERRSAYRVLVEKTEGKRQLGKPSRRWEDNIEMDLQEVGWGYEMN
jgi:hypothetical protein